MTAGECRILIADDEYWVRENIRGMLSGAAPFHVLEPAEDGREAAQRIEREHPDILITDINMPQVDGNELIRVAKKARPQMQVIVLSGYSDFDLVRQALLGGAIDYLLKPVTRSALLEVVDKAMSLMDAGQAQETERAELMKKVALATSLLRDERMSTLITEDSADSSLSATTADLELSFAAFTLILVRLLDLPDRSRRGTSDRSDMERSVKATIAARVNEGRAVVFHNIFALCEFIVITDLDAAAIARVCRDLTERLRRSTASRVRIAVSGSYNSFSNLRAAYQEARAAILTRPVGASDALSWAEEAHGQVVQKRLGPETEKRLVFALQSGNRRLARDVAFSESGLRECERQRWQLIEVKLTAEYIAGTIIQHAARAASPGATLAMESLAGLLASALESEDVSEVCNLLEQLLDEAFGEPGPAGVSDSAVQTARKVQRYIDEHYFEALSLTTLSRQFGLERSHLSRMFSTVTGQHVMSAIATRRIERAARYIREEDLSLTEISYLVGYEEYAYFNRVFRKIMGVSPSDYRASVRTEAAT